MNKNIENCLYQAGLTAQGCWDELDDYAREGIEKFAELIVEECAKISEQSQWTEAKGEYYEGFNEAMVYVSNKIKEHFGLENES